MENKGKIKVVKVEVMPMSADDLKKAKNGKKKARMYFWPTKETIVENLVARKFRPKVLYRTAFEEIFEKAGIGTPTRITWSQYAGCASCPCSPGFALDGLFNVNIHVTYEGAQVAEEVAEEFAELKANQPKAEEPVIEEPVSEEPKVEVIEPVIEEPKVEEPKVEVIEPVGEELKVEEPVRDGKGRFLPKVKKEEEVTTV